MSRSSMTLANLAISIEEWAHNRRLRAFANELTTTGEVKGLSPTQRGVVKLAAGLSVQVLQISTPADGTPRVVRVRQPDGSACVVKAVDFERNVAPTGLAVSQIRSGNSHLLQHFRCTHPEQKPKQAALTDADPQPAEVRVTTHDIDVQLMDGSIDTISKGITFDVCRSSRTKGFCVLRTEQGQHTPFHESQLRDFSVLKLNGINTHIEQDRHTDYSSDRCDMQALLVVHKKTYGLNRLGQLIPIEEGTKVLLTTSCNAIDFFIDTSGKIFALTEDQTSHALIDIEAENAVLTHARQAGLTRESEECRPGGWSSYQHHNDRVSPGSTTVDDIITAGVGPQQIANLPRNREGLPLPPSGYVPQQYPGLLAVQFGHYDFASSADQAAAEVMGIPTASDVVWAAHRGKSELGDIMLRWVPGTLEGTQAPFGKCNAYVMITIVNDMRIWHFGKGPVPHGELPIFSGLDEFWHEREGADVSELHRLPRTTTTRSLLTEAAIAAQMYDRQGYVGRAMRPVQQIQNFHQSPSPEARALQQEILRASDRSWQLGQPIERTPIDSHASPKERTSTHPYFVHVDFHQALPDVLYVYHKGTDRLSAKALGAQAFKAFKNCFGPLEHELPLLNAYGEKKSTIVKGQDKSTREILITDMPHVPARIASNEWHPVLGAMFLLGMEATSWNMLMARMPEETRSYCNWYQSMWLDSARRYRLLPDKIQNNRNSRRRDAIILANPIPVQLIAANTMRGIAPGPVDRTLAYGQVAFDHSGQIQSTNWVNFPVNSSEEHHPKDRFAKLDSGRSSRDSRIQQARAAKIAEQTTTARAAGYQARQQIASDEDDEAELESEGWQTEAQYDEETPVSSEAQQTAEQQNTTQQNTLQPMPLQTSSATAEDQAQLAQARQLLAGDHRRDSAWYDTAILGSDEASVEGDMVIHGDVDNDEKSSNDDDFDEEDEESAANHRTPGSCARCGEYHAPYAGCIEY
ncbi:hypothetical protein Slin15195_G048550 [Septoria linicola]|uniref:Uncharacterized protein n=1 Tax=Septoria linicola TaxID=215465 RepID=A0A9Q9AVN5_9PEZI|nr:hypothetical protein Slin14017_G052110 [Septoria linicola]USW51536.1 hypothetical protein Slin15195_G048550 [Septoria linicola]